MIVSEVMTTKLVTVVSEDTLSHAANLLRQYQFHHLPVVRVVNKHKPDVMEPGTRNPLLLLEGLLTSQDIQLAAALGMQNASDLSRRPWQEQRVVEVMHRATVRVTPNTSVAAAAQMLVERGLNCLPVVEYEDSEQGAESVGRSVGPTSPRDRVAGDRALRSGGTQTVLVGLLTRSDLLMALARSMGAFEPGMQLTIPLPQGDLTPLAQTLLLAAELYIQVRSVIAAPLEDSAPRHATVHLGTINPTPLLIRLQEAGIAYTFVEPEIGGSAHV